MIAGGHRGSHSLSLIIILFCRHDVPLKKSRPKSPMAIRHRPLKNVNVQPTPIASIRSWRNDTVIAANEQRTMLLEA